MKEDDLNDLVKSIEQVAAWLGGEDVPGFRVHFPPGGDVAAIRRRTGLSQSDFARQVGVSLGTLRNWEQGRRCPDGAARVLLAMLDKDPEIVSRTLSKAA